MYPHRIRLRGPWQAQGITADGWSAPQRVNWPGGWSTWVAGSPSSAYRVSRHFGMPRMIDEDETVWLVWHGPIPTQLELNGESANEFVRISDGIEFAVTTRLKTRNEIVALINHDEAAPEVALEIRGPVFLRDVAWDAECFHWRGLVVGVAQRPLELHLLAFGRLMRRVPVSATIEGTKFQIARPTEMPDGPCNPQAPPWQLELIEVSNRWHVESLQVPPAEGHSDGRLGLPTPP